VINTEWPKMVLEIKHVIIHYPKLDGFAGPHGTGRQMIRRPEFWCRRRLSSFSAGSDARRTRYCISIDKTVVMMWLILGVGAPSVLAHSTLSHAALVAPRGADRDVGRPGIPDAVPDLEYQNPFKGAFAVDSETLRIGLAAHGRVYPGRTLTPTYLRIAEHASP